MSENKCKQKSRYFFGVAVNDDDTLTLDMGDLGSATVEEATIAVAVQGLKYAVENGTEMN